jgi:hypothetical protein
VVAIKYGVTSAGAPQQTTAAWQINPAKISAGEFERRSGVGLSDMYTVPEFPIVFMPKENGNVTEKDIRATLNNKIRKLPPNQRRGL